MNKKRLLLFTAALICLLFGCSKPKAAEEEISRPSGLPVIELSPEPTDREFPLTDDPEVLLRRLAGRTDNKDNISCRYLGDYSGTSLYSIHFTEDEKIKEAVRETVAGCTFYNSFTGNPYPLAIYAVLDSTLIPLREAYANLIINENDVKILLERDTDAKGELYGTGKRTDYQRILEILRAVNFEFSVSDGKKTVHAFQGLLTHPDTWNFYGLNQKALLNKYKPYYVMPESAVNNRARDIFGDAVTVEHKDFILYGNIKYTYKANDRVYTYLPTGGIRSPEPYITSLTQKDGLYGVTVFFLVYPGEYEDFGSAADEKENILLKTLPNKLPLTLSQAKALPGARIMHEFIFRKENGRLILASCKAI